MRDVLDDAYLIAHVEDEEVVRRSASRWIGEIGKKRLVNPRSDPEDVTAGQQLRNSELRSSVQGYHAVLRGVEAVAGRMGNFVTLRDAYRGFESASDFREDLIYRSANSLPFPKVVILDLFLNEDEDEDNDTAFNLLNFIRSHNDLCIRNIPVVVLSNSDSKDDIDEVMKLGANAYTVKGNREELRLSILSIASFWLGSNRA